MKALMRSRKKFRLERPTSDLDYYDSELDEEVGNGEKTKNRSEKGRNRVPESSGTEGSDGDGDSTEGEKSDGEETTHSRFHLDDGDRNARNTENSSFREELEEKKPPTSMAPDSTILRDLESCVDEHNQLHLMDAGMYLRRAYDNKDPKVQEVSSEFCKKFASKVTSTLLPPSMEFRDDRCAMAFMAGTALTAALSIQQSARTPIVSSPAEQFQNLRGAAFYVKSEFKYPTDPPFNGEHISTDGFPSQNKAPHVHLKHCLFIVLGRGLLNPEQVNDISFVLPAERYSRGSIASFAFPEKLYEDLKHLFLEYFNLKHEELDTSFEEGYATLPFLGAYSDIASKRKLFKQMAASKQAYCDHTYNFQLKEALVELRNSVYTPPQSGKRYGTFQYRKRGQRAKKDEDTSSKDT